MYDKKIGTVLFVIGIAMTLIGMPYLLGYSKNEFLKYALYLGMLVTIIFTPARTIKKQNKK
ncbi:hypothetical protein B1B04_00095 [Lysinibacillus sp. KCTC 33748]|uniref:hypothetical protein n=1 Tax=unclassified Lysinibacillus TaxID=2636778 RepID=UPI0009A8DA86|nr:MULTISPECIES: hypothetical protein [unclassified Lysinibacillus]OXS76840.1 hypothetical protein B1B04_00095 [Lysinibacillus sp. KCTC 33748]SKB26773.1 hypothetical protein SAMN06295926_10118 [Lysinibacillus sp. AC-3]